MPDITLTEAEAQALLRCLNDRVEPPADLAAKLFPSVQAKFDFRTLNNARIPTIEYAGKRSEAAILNEASAFGAGSPLQVVRFFQGGKLRKGDLQPDLFIRETGETYETGWKNLIVQGDNLQFLKTCFINQDPIIKDKVKGKVKLIYMDPPFGTKGDFEGGEGEESYSDKVDRAEFVEAMRERLLFTRDILTVDGTLYIHLDQRMSHFIRVVLDEVFGRSHFLNEIIWQKTRVSKAQSRTFGNMHDTLFVYSMSDQFAFQPQYLPHGESYQQSHYGLTEKDTGRKYGLWDFTQAGSGEPRRFDGKVISPPPGKHWIWSQERIDEGLRKGLIVFTSTGMPRLKRYFDESRGRQIGDIWDDVFDVNAVAEERLGYPTQKPEALLERILLASSNPGDLVMDPFGGSGTTAAVAEKLGRRWITCDFGKHAIYTIQSRIATIADSQKLGLTPEQSKKKVKYDKAPQDFGVVSVGAFDFSRIMDLRKNKDAYIAFVLGIFGITERGEHFAKKYHVSNVIAEKDGHPVEVYPVWEDKWLREVRIDEDYLKGIVRQANGKLKGTYYIITPQACTRVGEVTMANGNGGKITFKTMTFPYKILEDAARHFQLSEQPDSPENINRLISSVGFYFNEEVEFKVKKTGKGFKVTTFKTTITDTNEKAFEGLDGLAMILVDTDYDGETFKVDSCFYQKDLKDGEVALKGANGKTALIAVDKHGNESSIVGVK